MKRKIIVRFISRYVPFYILPRVRILDKFGLHNEYELILTKPKAKPIIDIFRQAIWMEVYFNENAIEY